MPKNICNVTLKDHMVTYNFEIINTKISLMFNYLLILLPEIYSTFYVSYWVTKRSLQTTNGHKDLKWRHFPNNVDMPSRLSDHKKLSWMTYDWRVRGWSSV